MSEEFVATVAGVGALAEPARRALYLFVAAQPEPVSREQAAEGCNLALHSVKFHLDRLVDEGLLEVEFRRLSGRTGPGAGRPSKLYRRAARQLSVSLPERRYDLAGEVLAAAIDRSTRDGVAVADAVAIEAEEQGRRIASRVPTEQRVASELDRTTAVLARSGYEPRIENDAICLANCPFDNLAREHTELVCAMNLSLVGGLLDELACETLEAVLDPQPGLCCVRTRTRG